MKYILLFLISFSAFSMTKEQAKAKIEELKDKPNKTKAEIEQLTLAVKTLASKW